VKKAVDDNASNLHILKDWVSDMSEYIGTCKDETIGKVTEQTNLSKKSCLVIGNIDRQLETIKTLVVTSLQHKAPPAATTLPEIVEIETELKTPTIPPTPPTSVSRSEFDRSPRSRSPNPSRARERRLRDISQSTPYLNSKRFRNDSSGHSKADTTDSKCSVCSSRDHSALKCPRSRSVSHTFCVRCLKTDHEMFNCPEIRNCCKTKTLAWLTSSPSVTRGLFIMKLTQAAETISLHTCLLCASRAGSSHHVSHIFSPYIKHIS